MILDNKDSMSNNDDQRGSGNDGDENSIKLEMGEKELKNNDKSGEISWNEQAGWGFDE